MSFKVITVVSIILTFLFSCRPGVESSEEKKSAQWLIPIDRININDLRDFIPPIENPEFVSVGETHSIFDENYANVVRFKGKVKIYPQQITNWHEVVNDSIGAWKYSLTFCPVTGSSLSLNRVFEGRESSFGVSGMVYLGNLILYDRLSESFWSQMMAKCVNGEFIGSEVQFQQSIEMNYELATILFPGAEVLSANTGFDFPYHLPTNSKKLPGQERHWGIFIGEDVLLFAQNDFEGSNVVKNIEFAGKKMVVFGGNKYRFLNAFSRRLGDGTILTFKVPQELFPAVLEDNEGNLWDIFGRAIAGKRSGAQLTWIKGYMAFLFAWQDFFPEHVIWEEKMR